jgi:excisionase family DNA binding protein
VTVACYRDILLSMPDSTRAVFVRIPAADADRLDRAAFELKTPKRDLITTLVSRYVRPDDPAALAALRPAGEERRRVVVETDDNTLTVGRHAFQAAAPLEVLTLAQVADLLQVPEAAAAELAETGELPGRRVGEDWRFSRAAVLAWLGGTG